MSYIYIYCKCISLVQYWNHWFKIHGVNNFKTCHSFLHLLPIWQYYLRDRPISVAVTPSFYIFCNNFAWWPYWTKNVGNFCRGRTAFIIDVFDWIAFGITEWQQQNGMQFWKILFKLLPKLMLTIHVKTVEWHRYYCFFFTSGIFVRISGIGCLRWILRKWHQKSWNFIISSKYVLLIITMR